MNTEIEKSYIPSHHEDEIYKLWEDSGFFNPDNLTHAKEPFSIAMPPPNATGNLHVGHALMLALQDLIIRFNRLSGKKTLWIPGTDHASIATQNKVEKLLAREGIHRKDLTREEFLQKIGAYVDESRATIRTQIRKMGSSCDWSRERYTLDAGLSRAVSEIFVRMYNDGLIYRDYRIVNWCPRCTSTLADDEVEHIPEQGALYHIAYTLKDSSDTIVVATTRPETLLGDTAIAVHPDDERYQKYIGKIATLPLVGRELPIIADTYVEKEFGTGALKVTPAHDMNDFLLGKKYSLNAISILNELGAITLDQLRKRNEDISHITSLDGLDRFTAREQIVFDLRKSGHLTHEEPLQHSVSTCYRCDTIIEPYISLQWFISVDTKIPEYKATLKELSIETVQSKKTVIIPERFEKNYFHWVNNLRDWCISRQIVFGHQLPVYYCRKEDGGCGETLVAVTPPAQCTSCPNTHLTRDQDTLDTWFSSGLWTFSTLGWPDTVKEDKGKIQKKGDLATYHPTSVLETGYDILTFWVARMILMSRYALNEVPFKTVYLHGMTLDKNGKKMSKSHEETMIDPLDMIEQYGTDALRLSMIVGVTPGNDVRLYEEKIANYRNFVNKLWNIGRFVIAFSHSEKQDSQPKQTLADRWILSTLHATIKDVTRHLSAYRFSQAAESLRAFTWDDLADWYLETAKIEGDKRELLRAILESLLILWHPFAPFITEVLYQHCLIQENVEGTKKPALLMIAHWPIADEKRIDGKVEREFTLIRTIIQTIRNARAENAIPIHQKIQAIMYPGDQESLVRENEAVIRSLARLDVLTLNTSTTEKPENALFFKAEEIEIYLPLGMMNIEEERARLKKEKNELTERIESLAERLANKEFLERAPQPIIQKEEQKLSDYRTGLLKIEEQLQKLYS